MGVETAQSGQVFFADLFTPILDRGTVIPASRVRRFHALSPGQREVRIRVFQGEHSRCTNNLFLGELTVKVPFNPKENEEVEIRFTYDLNGLLEVEVRNSAGETHGKVLEGGSHKLSPEEIAHAVAAMADLKSDHRESLPNRVALERAQSAFQEVRGERRDFLQALTLRFETQLELGDLTAIEAARRDLCSVLEDWGL